MAQERLLNRFRLVKMRPQLVGQLDYLDTNGIIDTFYSEGILNEEKRKILYCTEKTDTNSKRNLLDILERNIELEDQQGSTVTFDMFLECLGGLNHTRLVDMLKNCPEQDLLRILQNRQRQEILNISDPIVSTATELLKLKVVTDSHPPAKNSKEEIDTISSSLNVNHFDNSEQRDSVDTSGNVMESSVDKSPPQEEAAASDTAIALNPENETIAEPEKPRKVMKKIGRELEKEAKRLLLEAFLKKS